MSESLKKVHDLGQSIWFDNIHRRLLENGELANLIQQEDIWGVTSNPTIFNNAIAKSQDYDVALKAMAWAGWSTPQIFDRLIVEDICTTADLFHHVHAKTNGIDGYVSIEVSPYIAHDTEKTISEARRLWHLVDRPNVMIKIPATKEGIPAIQASIAAGININITLIFSLKRYLEVIEAYMSGLEERIQAGLPIDKIRSVASFFISRFDVKIDGYLDGLVAKGGEVSKKASALYIKAGIAGGRLAYALFKDQFSSVRFEKIRAKGGNLQRPLWASTSTKNPKYSDVLYVEQLIAPDTIDTIPPKTLDAFRDHGKASASLEGHEKESQKVMDDLMEIGISFETVGDELEVEGVDSFADSITALLATIEERRKNSQKELGALANAVVKRISSLEVHKTVQRLFDNDASLWTKAPAAQKEIQNRLGWLKSPWDNLKTIEEYAEFMQDCQREGFTHALLLGMGGSSLAPEVLAMTFGVREGDGKLGLDLTILDSTDPAQIKAAERKSPLEKTLFIVSSKSGTTSEVNAFMEYFWAKAQKRLGKRAPDHFVAITDPGTKLEEIARERQFRKIFSADPNIGGRYSVISPFGLVPAVLIGLDENLLLQRSIRMANQCHPDTPTGRNPGVVLGSILAESSLNGRNKLTLLIDPEINSFGSWLEQLVAESSGKLGKGIIPVDLEPALKAKSYSTDRVFVYLRLNGKNDELVSQLIKLGHPVVTLPILDEYDLGGEFYRWEIAIAVACSILGINAFDQPDVQDSKTRTEQKIAQYQKSGTLDEGAPIWTNDTARVYGNKFSGLEQSTKIDEVIVKFLKQARPGDYIALNAYLPRNPAILAKLQKFRTKLQKQTRLPVTLGFGPRFLHSTGQLQKGGPDQVMVLQITANSPQELQIPTLGLTFNLLERAQAVGDLEALLARGRRAIRVQLDGAKLDDLLI
jgi:transaldolase / glucose-6-phosphate isomerase